MTSAASRLGLVLGSVRVRWRIMTSTVRYVSSSACPVLRKTPCCRMLHCQVAVKTPVWLG